MGKRQLPGLDRHMLLVEVEIWKEPYQNPQIGARVVDSRAASNWPWGDKDFGSCCQQPCFFPQRTINIGASNLRRQTNSPGFTWLHTHYVLGMLSGSPKNSYTP